MSLPEMPDTVPYRPRRGEWQMSQPWLAPLRTQMNGGNTRARSRAGDNVATISQTIRMSPTQYDTFDAFVRGALLTGTGRFTWNVFLGSAYAGRTVQFAEDPVPGEGGLRVAVAMKLLVYGL
jgi:hypothetical protein